MKKIFALLMAIVMMSLTFALAALPSKTSGDIATVGELVADGDENKDIGGLQIIIVEDETVDETLGEIVEATKEKTPFEFFPEDVQKEIAEKLGEDFDPKTLELNEFVALDVIGYEPEKYGSVMAPFTFETEYKADQKVFPVLGFYDNGEEIEWVTLGEKFIEGEVQEDGSVNITFEDALLARMDASPSIAMALLSTPAAAE